MEILKAKERARARVAVKVQAKVMRKIKKILRAAVKTAILKIRMNRKEKAVTAKVKAMELNSADRMKVKLLTREKKVTRVARKNVSRIRYPWLNSNVC